MKFKLDENLGPSIHELFVRRRYDCRTVREEQLGGAIDDRVLEVSISEERILVTMDHDFGNVLLCTEPPVLRSSISQVELPGLFCVHSSRRCWTL